ncbi:MAG: ATP-binding protein [Pseudomonadota bacterium]
MAGNHIFDKHPADPAAGVIAVSEFFDGHPVPTFVIDNARVVTHWNKACERLLGWAAQDMVGTRNHWKPFFPRQRPLLADLIVLCDIARGWDDLYAGRMGKSSVIPGAYEVEDFYPNIGAGGHWLHVTAAPLRDGDGRIVGAIETLRDVTERRVAENALRKAHDNLEHLVDRRTAQLAEVNAQLEQDIARRQLAEDELRGSNIELTDLNEKLSMAQQQLLQSEKLASIGQLAAGVAHEINNPIGYVFSNVSTLQGYLDNLFQMLQAYQDAESAIGAPEVAAKLRAMRGALELDYLRNDIPVLMHESREGIARVRHIVQDLKDFSRIEANQEWVWANVHQGIDSTLNIVSNEVKYKADVVKQYGDLPEIECLPSQLNQVIMNLVVNAAHAMDERRGTITLRTGVQQPDGPASDTPACIWLEVSDNGSGIAPEVVSRIFDPFFTTKPIGKGTGLGLSLAYGIVQKHQGQITVDSAPGRGTTFRITLPVRQTAQEGPSP